MNKYGNKSIDQNRLKTVSPIFWFGVILIHLLIALVLFMCAWDFNWSQAWFYSALIVSAGIGPRIWTEKKHPGLMAERSSFGQAQDVKSWDKMLSPLMAVSMTFPLVTVAGLDHRFMWSPEFPVWLNILGFILIVFGYGFAGWAMVENRFFSSVMRIQMDRGHMVCNSGPYRFVRHPGYAGNILALPGIVLALSSIWTIIPVTVALFIAVIRTALEDKTLQEELVGYKDYVGHVRYKLVPGVF